jgi:Bacterial regulatory proteins, luxR family
MQPQHHDRYCPGRAAPGQPGSSGRPLAPGTALRGLTVGHGSLLLVAGTGRPPASPRPEPPEVLGLIAKGLNNAAIAQRLQLVPKTVRNLASSVFAKLQVADRAQAMRRALGEVLGK